MHRRWIYLSIIYVILNAVMCPYVRTYVRNAERGVNDVIMTLTIPAGDMAIGDMCPRVALL